MAVRAKPSKGDRREIGRMQSQHQHAEDVFPEEGRHEEPFSEDDFFPDRAGDHDCIKNKRLDHDRERGDPVPLARHEIADHQSKADQKDEELGRCQNALNEGPDRRIAPSAFFRGVERHAGGAVCCFRSTGARRSC